MDSQPNRETIAHNLPLLLSIDEMANPLEVLRGFLSSFDLESLRRLYELILFIALEIDDERLGLDITRSELSLFLERLPRVFEAIYCLTKLDQND
jgi:hypothetical protein